MSPSSPATPRERPESWLTPPVRRSPRLTELQSIAEDDIPLQTNAQRELRTHPALIRIQVDDTVNQRVNTAKFLGKHTIEADSWDEVKDKLWEMSRRHLQPLATFSGEPPTWSLAESDPTIDMFHNYISMRLQSSRQINPWQSSNDRKYVNKHREETYLVTVLKYGNAITKAPELEEFQSQCLEPSAVDRAGAAAEALIQSLIAALKDE
ncbi:hypothetical protein AC1031_002327 [Aphanomyces cochlioides]|nr:hypothetical protein AC1031_002327 [Aphanomyces cochlioides]